MRRVVSCLVLFFVTIGTTGARAQKAPAPPPQPSVGWDGQPAQPAPPAPPPGWGHPAPYGATGYQSGSGYGPSPQALMIYESEKKNAGLALLIEVFVPGVGSIYAEHTVGALITWGLMVAGVAVMITGFREAWESDQNPNTGEPEIDTTPIWLGLGLMLGGRIYGLIDAYSSAKSYNASLAQRLGLGPMQLSVAPIRMGEVTAFGPAIGFRF